MKCPKCNNLLKKSCKFCSKCGTSIVFIKEEKHVSIFDRIEYGFEWFLGNWLVIIFIMLILALILEFGKELIKELFFCK